MGRGQPLTSMGSFIPFVLPGKKQGKFRAAGYWEKSALNSGPQTVVSVRMTWDMLVKYEGQVLSYFREPGPLHSPVALQVIVLHTKLETHGPRGSGLRPRLLSQQHSSFIGNKYWFNPFKWCLLLRFLSIGSILNDCGLLPFLLLTPSPTRFQAEFSPHKILHVHGSTYLVPTLCVEWMRMETNKIV